MVIFCDLTVLCNCALIAHIVAHTVSGRRDISVHVEGNVKKDLLSHLKGKLEEKIAMTMKDIKE